MNPRSCMICDGPISDRNLVGICIKTPECRREGRKIHDRSYTENRRVRKVKAVPKRKQRASWNLPEDGIIDDIAIELTVAGVRRVALTMKERKQATEIMIARHYNFQEIQQRLHLSAGTLSRLLRVMGYTTTPDPLSPSDYNYLLVRKA